ncbi:MAG: hypothetical protein JKY03_10050 [Aureispira sp.]|nr:hypothetical protein [Aureispira sp.]
MNDYLDKANELTKGLNSLFSGVTLWKFLKWCLSIIIICGIVLFVYEKSFSSSFYYDKIDRKLQIIEQVKKLGKNDSLILSTSNQKLLETLQHLDLPENRTFTSGNLNFYITESLEVILIKLLGVFILPLLIVFAIRDDPNKSTTITGAVIFSVIFALIVPFVPIWYSPWLNAGLTPIVQIIVLLPLMKLSK